MKSIKDSWIDCYEIVNDLVAQKFAFNILEPQSEVKMVTKAKVQMPKPSV